MVITPAGIGGGGDVGALFRLESVGAAGEASRGASGAWEAEAEEVEVEGPASAPTSSSTSMLDMCAAGRQAVTRGCGQDLCADTPWLRLEGRERRRPHS